MELPNGFTQENVFLFDQRALQNLVMEIWGKEYDTGAALDFPHNGSHYDWKITGLHYDTEYILDQGEEYAWNNDSDGWFTLERVIERLDAEQWFSPGPQDVLTALVEIGKLPAGKYILDYWW